MEKAKSESAKSETLKKLESSGSLVQMDTENTTVTFSKERKAFMKILVSCWKKCFKRKSKD